MYKKESCLLCLLLVFVFTSSGCSNIFVSNKETSETHCNACTEIKLENITTTKNSVNITVDPRLELLSVVQYLSNYDKQFNLITDFDFKYKNEIENTFSKYKNHEAVTIFEKLYKKNFSFDAPPTFVLYLTNDFKIRNDVKFTDYLKGRAGGEKNLIKFANALNKFYIDTNFGQFFNNHTEEYKGIIKNVADNMGDKNYADELEKYYGKKQNSYNIMLVPLFHPGGFGPKLKNDNDIYDIYSIVGTHGLDGEIITFGNTSDFQYLQRHEFSHSFVNYLSDKHISTVNKCSHLFTPIEGAMKRRAYNNWQTCLNEHIVRAVTIRLTYAQDKAEGDKLLKIEKSNNNFIYVDKLVLKLDEYEKNRSNYKTFEDFYPELLKVFDDIK